MPKQLSILCALKMSLSHLADHIMFVDFEMFRLESEGKILLVTEVQCCDKSAVHVYIFIVLKENEKAGTV